MTLNEYKRILAIAKAGLLYAKDEYDKERYTEIKELSLKLINKLSVESYDKLLQLTNLDEGYPTPKVDVRGIIKKDDKILLVEDSKTKLWSLPGGFAEIGLSPEENIIKEVKEETGYDVQVNSLEGIFDTNLDTQNPQLFQYYKLIFECSIIKGEFEKNIETSNINFFDIQNLPPLSEKRTTKDQLTKLLLSKSSNAYFE